MVTNQTNILFHCAQVLLATVLSTMNIPVTETFGLITATRMKKQWVVNIWLVYG